MVMRPYDPEGTRILIAGRIEALRGGRRLASGRRASPRPN
jgi:hypothetical protein